MHPHHITLPHPARRKLLLHQSSPPPRPRQHHHPRRRRIQPVRRPHFVRINRQIQQMHQGVPAEPSRWVHRQWRRLVHHHQRLVRIQHPHRRIHRRLNLRRNQMHQSIPTPHHTSQPQHFPRRPQQPPRRRFRLPLLLPHMRHHPPQTLHQRPAITFLRHLQRPEVIRRHTPRQRLTNRIQPLLQPRHPRLHNPLRRQPATRTTPTRHILLRLLILRRQRSLTRITLRTVRLLQRRIQSHPVIKHKALPVIVIPPAFLEILQNPPIQLVNLPEPLPLHIRPRLLAPDPPSAEHHHRLLLHLLRQCRHRLRKIPEMPDPRRHRTPERP